MRSLLSVLGGFGVFEVEFRLAASEAFYSAGELERAHTELRETLRQVQLRADDITDPFWKDSYLTRNPLPNPAATCPQPLHIPSSPTKQLPSDVLWVTISFIRFPSLMPALGTPWERLRNDSRPSLERRFSSPIPTAQGTACACSRPADGSRSRVADTKAKECDNPSMCLGTLSQPFLTGLPSAARPAWAATADLEQRLEQFVAAARGHSDERRLDGPTRIASLAARWPADQAPDPRGDSHRPGRSVSGGGRRLGEVSSRGVPAKPLPELITLPLSADFLEAETDRDSASSFLSLRDEDLRFE